MFKVNNQPCPSLFDVDFENVIVHRVVFVFDSFFEQDHLLNLKKDDLNVHVLFKAVTEDHSIGWILSEKKYRGTGLVSEKMEIFYAKLNERVETATSRYTATDELLQYIYSVVVAKNHQKILSRCLLHGFSFTDTF